MKKIKILSVFGTRPEAIKMAPLIRELENDDDFISKVCVTAQHREMLDQVLSLFNIEPDYDLNLMASNQGLIDITTGVLRGLDSILDDFHPDYVLVHGDTTTTLAATIACYYKKIKVGHVEAGLRTGDIYSPWPEEGNRKVVGSLCNMHFAPTQLASEALLSENISSENIFITGNTVIDSLILIKEKIIKDNLLRNKIKSGFGFSQDKPFILITGHRRENFGQGFENICDAIIELAQEFKELNFVYPVHLNPNVKNVVETKLKNIDNIILIPPQDYLPFVYLMMQSKLILTDSGGIQEEAPSLGKPVLVMRDTTERFEAVEAGTVRLVGTNIDKIVSNVRSLLLNESEYLEMSMANNPYGDGKTSKVITNIIKNKVNSLAIL